MSRSEGAEAGLPARRGDPRQARRALRPRDGQQDALSHEGRTEELLAPGAQKSGLPQACSVLRETGTLEELAFGFVDCRDGYRPLEWGSTPIKTCMSARTSVPLLACAKDIPTLCSAPIPLLSHSARRVLYGGTQA